MNKILLFLFIFSLFSCSNLKQREPTSCLQFDQSMQKDFFVRLNSPKEMENAKTNFKLKNDKEAWQYYESAFTKFPFSVEFSKRYRALLRASFEKNNATTLFEPEKKELCGLLNSYGLSIAAINQFAEEKKRIVPASIKAL